MTLVKDMPADKQGFNEVNFYGKSKYASHRSDYYMAF